MQLGAHRNLGSEFTLIMSLSEVTLALFADHRYRPAAIETTPADLGKLGAISSETPHIGIWLAAGIFEPPLLSPSIWGTSSPNAADARPVVVRGSILASASSAFKAIGGVGDDVRL